MSNAAAGVIQRHWALANARDWAGFERLLAPHLRYRVPQTRERIDTGAGYLDMFVTWPGDWQADVEEIVAQDGRVVCRVAFRVGGEVMTGLSYFTVSAEGLITDVTDYWPEAYDPPPRVSRHLVRDPPAA
jgi:hypothetical protein